MIAAFARARRNAKASPVTVVDDPRLQLLACRMAKEGRLDAKAVLGISGIRMATVYTASDLSQLPSTALKIVSDRSISHVEVGACFARSDKYEAGMNWVAVGAY